jgi:hypothetical protein
MPLQPRISLPLTAPGVAAIPSRAAFRRRGSRQQFAACNRAVLSSPWRASNKILLRLVEGLLAQLVDRVGQRTRPRRQGPDHAPGALPEPPDGEGQMGSGAGFGNGGMAGVSRGFRSGTAIGPDHGSPASDPTGVQSSRPAVDLGRLAAARGPTPRIMRTPLRAV